MFLSAIRKLLSTKTAAPARRPARPSLRLETLEARWVPATLTVDPTQGTYHTIGSALTAANPGDTINVDAGTYNEAVTVAKNSIKLFAQGSGVNVNSPATVATNGGVGSAVIDVTAANVTVSGFNVSGSANTDGNLNAGIRVRNNGSATIKNNTVTGLTNSTLTTEAIGIEIGTGLASGSAGYGTAKVTGNTINTYRGAGVLVTGGGSAATVKSNTITGRGTANGTLAEYGVQVSYGATARVQGNTISANTDGSNSAGILFFQDGGTKSVAAANTVSGNDIGIWASSSSGTSCTFIQIVNNDVKNNTGYAGIDVQSSDYVMVENNSVYNNTTGNGIALSSSNYVEVEYNCVHDNSNADGIYTFQSSNNYILCNNSYNNGGNGVFLEQSSNTEVWNNTTSSNGLNGIKILGGSCNDVWLGCSTTNTSDGVLLQNTSNNTIIANDLSNNSGYGIRLLNASNTFIFLNNIVGNKLGSIYSDSATTGTTSIANRTSSAPVVQGTSGANGTSNAYTNSTAAADTCVVGLDD